MGVCTSKRNIKCKQHGHIKRNCIFKSCFSNCHNTLPYCNEFGIIVIGYIRQFLQHQHMLGLSSDITYSIKTICTMYYGSIVGDLAIKHGKTLRLHHIQNIHFVYQSMSLHENAKLTVNRWNRLTSSGGQLHIVCKGDLVLKSGASITLDGRGYKGGNHARNGESYSHTQCTKTTANNHGGGGGAQPSPMMLCIQSTAGGGGGYGEYGCHGYEKPGKDTVFTHNPWDGTSKLDGVGGAMYGDPQLSTLHLGSGGGSGYRFEQMDNSLRADTGGSGGGALKITCFGKIIMENGSKISCSGEPGHGCMGGAGSGGSIHIVIKDKDHLQMRGDSRIEAVGGVNKYKCGGNGGNGRIRVEYLNDVDIEDDLCSYHNIIPKPYID
eukprot:194513_1